MIAAVQPFTPHDYNDRELGTFTFKTDATQFTLKLDALATDCSFNGGRIMLVSVAGSHTAVKALHACLGSNINVACYAQGGKFAAWNRQYKHDEGYRVFTHKLGVNAWHMLALAKDESLLPVLSDESLWQQIRSDRFTTPVLRDWTPWIMEQLIKAELLDKLNCFQCDAARLKADTAGLDAVVEAGLSFGQLTIN